MNNYLQQDSTVLYKSCSQSGKLGRNLIADLLAPCVAQSVFGLSLVFMPGERPLATDVLRLLASGSSRMPDLAVSHQPQPAQGWLELLAGGLTFDLVGLAPAAPAQMPAMAHWYGFPERPAPKPTEAITLLPGEQLRGAANLLPVTRAMAGIAVRLAQLAHVKAVVWHPARSVMSPAAFASVIDSWLSGGAFPALGLTALFRDSDGAIRSEGLAFFIGQELKIDRFTGVNTAQDAKIAARIINHLIEINAIDSLIEFMGPNGEKLSIAPSADNGLLRVWRRT